MGSRRASAVDDWIQTLASAKADRSRKCLACRSHGERIDEVLSAAEKLSYMPTHRELADYLSSLGPAISQTSVQKHLTVCRREAYDRLKRG